MKTAALRYIRWTTAAVALLASPVASAAPWDAVAHQCADMITTQLHQQTGCANCSDTWPLWAECTANTIYGSAVPADRMRYCITKIWNERWRARACSACGNPVDDTMHCLGAR